MKTTIRDLFKIEKHPRKNLFAMEWVIMAYLLFTTIYILINYSRLDNPQALLTFRAHIIAITAALYLVYRLVPCRFTRVIRPTVQLALLSWWYPDTYELNKMIPNLDHLFAQWEQSLLGCQPALIYSESINNPIVTELLDLGYASYYPLIALVCYYYFFRRYEEFQRCVFIVTASFFLYYVIFIFFPVAGPTFYYQAVGIEEIAKGVFPNLQDYFRYHTECLPTPGYTDGIFYQMVEGAKAAGERPTAAFPCSHVGITVVLLFLAWHSGSRRLFYFIVPLFVLMFFATVYI
ncbi:MAG: phosphatase PAP2 family protein, partial [Prevotella sp.]|nr:phosphatase PAP2 family protein [Prevotella sp.]